MAASLGRRLGRVLRSRWVTWTGAALFVVSVPLALVGSNVRYLFGETRLYTFAVRRYDVAAVSGIPQPELLRAVGEVRDYLLGPDELLRVQVTDAQGQSGPLFNPREVLHMRDVRALVQGIFTIQQAALAVALLYPALRLFEGRRGLLHVARLTWLTGLAVNLLAIAFGVSAALGFDRLFTQFHLLSFSNDLWLLDPARDHLVQLFPFPFWQLTTGLLIGMTLAEAALLAVVARWYLYRQERAAAQSEAASPLPAEATSTAAQP